PYDDGFDPSLWKRAAEDAPRPRRGVENPEMPGGAGAPAARYGRPVAHGSVRVVGYEDAPDLRRNKAVAFKGPAADARAPAAAADRGVERDAGFEDAPHLRRLRGPHAEVAAPAAS